MKRILKRRILQVGGCVIIGSMGLVAWVALGPCPIDPVAYEPPPNPGFVGEFSAEREFSDVATISLSVGAGPEDVAVDSAGRIYAGLSDGTLVRIDTDGRESKLASIPGGRPLGLHFDSQENLIVADAWKGLLSVSPDGDVQVLATEADGIPFGFTDDLDIASDGKIYFSDASHKFHQPDYKLDLVEARGNGRLLVYDPQTNAVECLLDDLAFANGVALSADESFVLVNETGRYRTLRYWLSGDQSGTSDIFIDALPAFPDGISSNRDGVFWLALASPRSSALDRIHPSVFLKRCITMLPVPQPSAQSYGLIAALNEKGEVLGTWHDPDGAPIHMVTSVEQVGDELFLGTLESPQIVKVPVPLLD